MQNQIQTLIMQGVNLDDVDVFPQALGLSYRGNRGVQGCSVLNDSDGMALNSSVVPHFESLRCVLEYRVAINGPQDRKGLLCLRSLFSR